MLVSAEESIQVVGVACRQVRNSPHLQQLMRLVLATGNLLNTGTSRGNAQGIKLDTLMKLADVKVSAARGSVWPWSLQGHMKSACQRRSGN